VTDKYDPFNLGCSTNFFFFSSIEDFCFELFMRRINGGQCCPQNVKNESHVLMKKKTGFYVYEEVPVWWQVPLRQKVF
jgi:hypothetical protein